VSEEKHAAPDGPADADLGRPDLDKNAAQEHVGTHRRPDTEDGTERSATFGEIFASGQFRALYSATMLSWVGDYLAKAAVTALVYHTTGSVAVSAATFAISYVPWVLGGPILAALAERYPYRQVMIVCDIWRAALVAVVAIPGMPVPAMLALLFFTALLNPPFEAARSALMPRVLDGDRYVQATVMQNVTGQGAQLIGYLIGAGMAAYHPHIALAVDSSTFALSAVLVGLFVRSYRPALDKSQRTHILHETGQGFSVVFGTDVLRAIAILIFTLMLFTALPEGLAAAWSDQLESTRAGAGLAQGLIMGGYPAGFILGGLVVGRVLPPPVRRRLIRPLAVLAPLAMVPALLKPSALVIALLALVCGFAVAGLFPSANALFVRALPDMFRARAFGVMQSGVQIIQGLAIFVCGWLADRFDLPTVVGLWSLAGVLVMLVASAQWPSQHRFAAAFQAADQVNGHRPGHAGSGGGGGSRTRVPAAESA
jgi:MFS family permease